MENKNGAIHVEKLRSILLMESDLKCTNRLFIVVRIMKMSDKVKMIFIDKYGIRKGNSTIGSGINNKLLLGIIRMRIWDARIVSEDSHTTYGRIQHTMIYWCL